MSIYSDVRQAIRKGAIAALSEYPTTPIIFSHSNGTEPAESYVVVNILNIQQIGHHATGTLTSQTEQLAIRAFYECMVQFSFVGSKSGEMSQSFIQRINQNPICLEELKRNNLGIMRKSQIRRAPQKRDSKWVEYQNMDVTFNYIVNTQQVVDVVEAVVIGGEMFDPPTFSIPPGIVYP